ncbi:hypothetical protein TNIN_106841 [Trichonephila inaurata madagascariensis]|uniref:Uncharacterized protein n=1 Tax=Trichonephila inaurata madagascariensis TaxID=2747483 RepID=A0A8X7CCI5_9ARAC|nr:hypothetical protein TNIN_106841 [Trichonephila inaurata madagascariensis]
MRSRSYKPKRLSLFAVKSDRNSKNYKWKRHFFCRKNGQQGKPKKERWNGVYQKKGKNSMQAKRETSSAREKKGAEQWKFPGMASQKNDGTLFAGISPRKAVKSRMLNPGFFNRELQQADETILPVKVHENWETVL